MFNLTESSNKGWEQNLVLYVYFSVCSRFYSEISFEDLNFFGYFTQMCQTLIF